MNAANQVAVVDLSDDGGRGRVARLHQSPAFAFPTALAVRGPQLLIVNAQLDDMGGQPTLPFNVVAVDVGEM